MKKEHLGFCGFCGSELSGWTEEHAGGTSNFLKCENCHKIWQFEFDKDGKMIGYGMAEDVEEDV